VFGRIAYDATSIKFVDLDIYQDHAGAITDTGDLYQWGCNIFGRCGIRDTDKNIFPPTLWEPKKVEHFSEYFIRQVACGSCHTVVLASPRKDLEQRKVFAFGREDQNGHHLACSN
jgi:alpha-tubulin suppressor-like RCC1 family protein